jgi:hypothetical protein
LRSHPAYGPIFALTKDRRALLAENLRSREKARLKLDRVGSDLPGDLRTS